MNRYKARRFVRKLFGLQPKLPRTWIDVVDRDWVMLNTEHDDGRRVNFLVRRGAA